VIEVSRHGARTSENIYPLTVDPADNFQVAYDLTQAGVDMHNDLGKNYVRQRYLIDKQFLSSEYDPNEVYVQTTDRQRTILSATSQLDGIYDRPTPADLQPDSLFVLDNVPDSINYLTHLNSGVCKRFGQVHDAVYASSEHTKSQDYVRASYEEHFLPRLRELTEMPTASVSEMFSVMDYLYWAKLSNLDLKFDLTEDDMKWINASVNSYVWADHFSDKEMWTLLSYEFMQQLVEFTHVLEGADWKTDAPYFTEYFDGSVFPKFIFYSAHSETVYPYLQSLVYPLMMKDAQPATALFIEFYESWNGSMFVRAYYNMAEAQDGEYVLYEEMPLLVFRETMNKRITESSEGFPEGTGLEEWCNIDYSAEGKEYEGWRWWETNFF